MKMFDAHKTRMIGLPYGEKTDNMLTSRFADDAMQARPMLSCDAVCVCPSCSYILSKRIKISSNFFHHRVASKRRVASGTPVFPYQTAWQ